ncbi:SUR7/PalI family-domain-containing protein [Calycina marina]|uniref:SUR7/PalI family-domain-containing protein n=1 Tax=Calycina marina TaxID=1763456 RepID=A0A9P8CDW8_9HELO|nr:SUR7/PalI family-domain-containing protein [Calycina marina]
MALPKFRSSRRRTGTSIDGDASLEDTAGSDRTAVQSPSPVNVYHPTVDVKKATKKRKHWIFIASLFFFISVVFLILTIIGTINDRPVIRSTYFFRLDLTNIIPASTSSDITLVNSLARSLGLHDFYDVGLWGFCEGYNDEGITSCSNPKSLYWFNPVDILLDELLSGATIALPAEINKILKLIRIASHVMFGTFLTGVCMNFVSIFITPIVIKSRWWSFPIALWTFIAALLTIVGTVIATVMFIIFRNVITSQSDLNIGASVGTQMFAFMWVGTAFGIFGFIIHLCLSCCCASRRDVTTGRRKGNKAAYEDDLDEKKPRKIGMPSFIRRKTAGQAV